MTSWLFNKQQFRADRGVAFYLFAGGLFISIAVFLSYGYRVDTHPGEEWYLSLIVGLSALLFWGMLGILVLGGICLILDSVWSFLQKIRDRYWIQLVDVSELPGVYDTRGDFPTYRTIKRSKVSKTLTRQRRRIKPRVNKTLTTGRIRRRKPKKGFWDRLFNNESQSNNKEDS